MLAGDGLPKGGTDLVTLSIVSCRRHEKVIVVYLRTDRSGGEPVARRADVSWCSIQCCAASRRTRGFVDAQEARQNRDLGRGDVQSHACWRFVWVMGATEAEDARSWVEAGGGAGGARREQKSGQS
jgi:hypothetical protein